MGGPRAPPAAKRGGSPSRAAIATDWNIIAGTSNWGAFALAAATLFLAGRTEALEPLDAEFHHNFWSGWWPTARPSTASPAASSRSVDGLPFATYIQAWLEIRRLIGVD